MLLHYPYYDTVSRIYVLLISLDVAKWIAKVVDIVSTRRGGIAASINAFNRRLAEDQRCHKIMIPIRDGLTLAIKK